MRFDGCSLPRLLFFFLFLLVTFLQQPLFARLPWSLGSCLTTKSTDCSRPPLGSNTAAVFARVYCGCLMKLWGWMVFFPWF